MPLTISYQIGSGQAVPVTFPISNARAKAMLERYARRHGLIQAGMTDAQVLEEVIRYSAKQMAAESAQMQKIEAVAAQEAALDATVAADNELG